MLIRVLKVWLPLAFSITALCGIVYLSVQQSYRQSANDPQIQMAEDTAFSLSKGTFQSGPQSLNPIDISKSLSTFTIIYDNDGKIISSDAVLNGDNPVVPNGVFDWVKSNGEDRVTMELDGGVRVATVIVPFSSTKISGYVLVGRNIKEVEKRVKNLTINVGIGWVITIFGILFLVGFLELVFSQRKK